MLKFQYINILGDIQIWNTPKYPHHLPSKDLWASAPNDNDVHNKFHIPSYMEIKGYCLNVGSADFVKWKNDPKQNHNVLEYKIVQLTCQPLEIW